MQLDLLKGVTGLAPESDWKVCKKCHTEKPVTEFRLYRRATGDRDSRDSKCKQCSVEQTRIAEQLRLTAPEHDGRCACCGKEEPKPVLDHCHDTGTFRGWLCAPCNLGLGVLGDTYECIEQAYLYLRKHRDEL